MVVPGNLETRQASFKERFGVTPDEAALNFMTLSAEEAIGLGQGVISTGHLLLAGFKDSATAPVLEKAGLKYTETKVAFLGIIPRGERVLRPEQLFVVPRVRIAIAIAGDEAGQFGHREVGSPHLLLASIKDSMDTASRALQGLQFDPGILRVALGEHLRG